MVESSPIEWNVSLALADETREELTARGYGDAGSSCRGYIYRGEPVMAVGFDAAGQGEKFVLNALGYRPPRACANLDAIQFDAEENARDHEKQDERY